MKIKVERATQNNTAYVISPTLFTGAVKCKTFLEEYNKCNTALPWKMIEKSGEINAVQVRVGVLRCPASLKQTQKC